MNAFETAIARGGVAIDRLLGEPIRIMPMTTGRYTSAAVDPDRAERVVTGNFLSGPGRTQVTDNKIGRELNSHIVVAPALVVFRRSAMTVGDEIVLPQRGDHIERVDHPEYGTFEASVVEPGGIDDYVVTLVKVTP